MMNEQEPGSSTADLQPSTTPARPTRAVLIQNPAAGQGDWQEQVDAAAATMRAAGWEVTLRQTTGAGDATGFAREAVAAGCDVVVVAGGDGTVNEALQGMAGQRRTALGVLPGGTVNVWATELGAGQREPDIARRITRGRRYPVDLGRVNGRFFLMMASAGIDAEANALVAEVTPLKRLKRLVGPVPYAIAAAITAIRYRGRPAALDIDGRPVARRLLTLVVGNTRLYGGIAEITYQARANDGLLDACIISGRGPLDFLRRLVSVLLRRHYVDPAIDYRKARRVVLDPARPLRIQADGEDIGQTPATFTIVPQALEVIILSDTPPGFLGAGE
ncbi:MAG: diacylglycerol kinase family lipid kinase [Chloroflexota bacterium]|nr:diacylglycerol kinase family lipid kinase [Chloroflexota bacterium]